MINLLEQNQYKIREYEWFEIETKIRLFVQKLLEPTLKQIFEDRVVVDSVDTQVRQNNKNVDMLKDIVLNKGGGVPIIQEFEKRFVDIDIKFEQLKREKASDITEGQRQYEKLYEEIRRIRETADEIQVYKNRMEIEFRDTQATNEDFRKNVETIIKNLSDEISINYSDMRLQINELGQKIQQSDLKIQDFKGVLQNQSVRIAQLDSQQVDFSKQQIVNISKFEHQDFEMKRLFQQNQQVQKQTIMMHNLQNQLRNLELFATLYQPIYVLCQISDCMIECLPESMMAKLAYFEQKVFDQLDKQILQSQGEPNVKLLIDQHMQIVERVTKRDQKVIFRSKNKELQSSKSDLDEPSINAPSDSDNTSKGNSPRKNFMMDLQYSESLFQEFKERVNNQIFNFEQKLDVLERQLNSRFKDYDDQQFVNQMNYQNQIQKLIDQLKEQIQILRESRNPTPKERETFQVEQPKLDLKIGELIRIMINYSVLITHLMIQDEIDRQGIQLMGQKETSIDDGLVFTGTNKKNKLIQLQGECLSCSGQPIQLLQQFKLACLAYNPSDINVDGKVFKRDQILDMCTKLLIEAKKSLQEQKFEVREKIRSYSIPQSPGAQGMIQRSIKLGKKVRKLAPMTNLHEL